MTSGGPRLRELASVVRSKNAGPFELTFDILFGDPATYRRVKASGAVTAERVAALYNVPVSQVLAVIHYDPGFAIKITLKRPLPSGDPGETDVYGCQQHVPLLDLEVPAAAA